MAKKIKNKDLVENIETKEDFKEKRGEIKQNFKKYYFPELGKTIEAPNIQEAIKRAK